ncbi:M67 family metallopeptidase [Microaerobacter geothermalis]|uniref:Mov34/MPN/PAD-1 family protein n=1 Tax=Microaerobacter geothermalis TaxID=674972 RepID=UPI001F3D290C|nr:M67 family metallopeptidase [Microaerobacter geothermalis]MCF6092387.1 M67 family metallopeptidase [Microaerobacter geothermalis]
MRLGNPFQHSPLIILHQEVYQQILTSASVGYPHEFCAILGGEKAEITRLYPLKNIAAEPERFFKWSPQEFIQQWKRIMQDQLEWVGVIHSHPHGKPYPSHADHLNWHYPQLSYWILSFPQKAEPKLLLFQWSKNGFVQQNYTIQE